MPIAYIALGSNLPSHAGTPAETLAATLMHIAALGQLVARSTLHTTTPVGYADQPDFLNAAVALRTSLTPHALLDDLLEIERSFGRDRTNSIPNGPRTLDLDLLLYSDYVLRTEKLQLPHPRMTRRAFVLIPLAEIAPGLIHPLARTTVTQLLIASAQAIEDPSPVESEDEPEAELEEESDDAPSPDDRPHLASPAPATPPENDPESHPQASFPLNPLDSVESIEPVASFEPVPSFESVD